MWKIQLVEMTSTSYSLNLPLTREVAKRSFDGRVVNLSLSQLQTELVPDLTQAYNIPKYLSEV